jgi:hypothetical protein
MRVADFAAARDVKPPPRWISPTRPLRELMEQAHSGEKQVGDRCGDFQSVQILRKPSVSDLLESEHPF